MLRIVITKDINNLNQAKKHIRKRWYKDEKDGYKIQVTDRRRWNYNFIVRKGKLVF